MTVIDGSLTERISAEANQVHLGRMLATAIAAVLFALGWSLAKTCRAVVFTVSWSIAAVRVGWQEGIAKSNPPRR